MSRAFLPVAMSVAISLSGCVPVVERVSTPFAPILYVANGADATVLRIDPTTGRQLGRPVPSGLAPWRVVPTARGGLLQTGVIDALARVPSVLIGMAISGDHLFTLAPEKNALWVLDRRGAALKAIDVGKGPVGLAIGRVAGAPGSYGPNRRGG